MPIEYFIFLKIKFVKILIPIEYVNLIKQIN